MNIYIVGPMTGHKDLNHQAFFDAEKILIQEGHHVFNPARLPPNLTLNQYMSIDLAMLNCADAIYLLDGWQQSAGVQTEFSLAMQLKLEIFTQS